jgi:hypothetical protein
MGPALHYRYSREISLVLSRRSLSFHLNLAGHHQTSRRRRRPASAWTAWLTISRLCPAQGPHEAQRNRAPGATAPGSASEQPCTIPAGSSPLTTPAPTSGSAWSSASSRDETAPRPPQRDVAPEHWNKKRCQPPWLWAKASLGFSFWI